MVLDAGRLSTLRLCELPGIRRRFICRSLPFPLLCPEWKRSMTARRIIIVGSGVAAAQVATRLLSRDKSLSILMLEAGPNIVMRDRRKWQDMGTAGCDPAEAHKGT